jgi:hypothetical protein
MRIKQKTPVSVEPQGFFMVAEAKFDKLSATLIIPFVFTRPG